MAKRRHIASRDVRPSDFCFQCPLLQSVLRQMLSENNDVVQGEYCSFGLTMQEMKTIRTEFGLHCKKISFIQDPFCLEKEDLRYLNSFLK